MGGPSRSSTSSSTTGTNVTSTSSSSNQSGGQRSGGQSGGGASAGAAGTGSAPLSTYMPAPLGTLCHAIGGVAASVVSAGQQLAATSRHGAYQLLDIVVESAPGPLPEGMRYNTFRHEGTPEPVIYQSKVPMTSPGWASVNHDFFNQLGTLPQTVIDAWQKRLEVILKRIAEIRQKLAQGHLDAQLAKELQAELERLQFWAGLEITTAQKIAQEYLLAGMPKGAMLDAIAIATKYGRFIAVRPTGVAAHMGIESGAPTKAQEFKNKTSKPMDAILCNEIGFEDIGSVVHYDPRVGWSSDVKMWEYFPAKPPKPTASSTYREREIYNDWLKQLDQEWAKKRAEIEKTMAVLGSTPEGQHQLDKMGYPRNEADWNKLKSWFESRLVEFTEEDPQYLQGGHYANAVHLNGPFIELKQRPGEHMYGDHDLFGFGTIDTNQNYQFVHDSDFQGLAMQHDLQHANVFQAQHGGIWNWNPDSDFNQNIKNVIMGAHSPPNGEPLLVFSPDGSVQPMFYIAPDKLESAWAHPEATKWMEGTGTYQESRQQEKK